MTKPNILLVGCGKMGGALLARWTGLGLYNTICVVEPSDIKTAAPRVADARDIPPGFRPDIIVFAVKPQALPEVAGHYRTYARNGAVVLSIAAGAPIGFFENKLGDGAKIVRAMPNTPAAIGKGITAACANANVAPAEKELAGALLAAVGQVIWLDDEGQLNAVTALSGSGPAYVFLLIEVLEKAGAHVGLAPGTAKKLARQTVIGSAALAEASPETPAAVLRENVTSPGGTTQAALDSLRDSDLQEIYNDALRAAVARAEELAG